MTTRYEPRTEPGARLSEALDMADLDRARHRRLHAATSGVRREATEPVSDLAPPSPAAHVAPAGRWDYGLGGSWGASWDDSSQGWVAGPDGNRVWRPIVATVGEFAEWEVDTFLGVVTGEAAVDTSLEDAALGRVLAEGREVARRGLVSAAVTRGAHAVIGAAIEYTPLGDRLLVTMSGTAVTLRQR